MAAIEIPSLVGFQSKTFNLDRRQQVTPVGSGYIQTINRSTPFWVAQYKTPPLAGDSYNEAITFFESLEGSTYTFLGFDPRRTMPYAYRMFPVTANPWLGSGQSELTGPRITGQDYTNGTINLDRMAVGAIITKGDYISVQVNSIWYLFRSVQTVTVQAGGTVSNLVVKPRPAIANFSTAVIRYKKACCEMKMLGGYQETDDVTTFPQFQFSAAQFINRGGA